MLVLFQFIVECDSILLRNNSVKVLITSMIVVASLKLPQYAYYKDARCADYLDRIWVNLQININQVLDTDKIVFGNVNSD